MSSSGALITLASLVNSEEISRETLVVCKKTPMRRVSHVTRQQTERHTKRWEHTWNVTINAAAATTDALK